MFKIAILDGYAVNPGDLSWSEIEELGQIAAFDYFDESIILKVGDANALLVNRAALSEETIRKFKTLKYIGTLGTGFNMIDIDYCKAAGIIVCNVPGYSTMSVSQHIFALLLSLTNTVGEFDQTVRQNLWTGKPGFDLTKFGLFELSGKTFGIIGLGSIGRQAAKIAQAFGMNVIATSRTVTQGIIDGIKMADIEYILKNSDILSLNCPLTEQTKGLINKNSIALMKNSAVIINTSRGPVINENDLADALNSGRIRGAAIDVMTEEPEVKNSPLLKAKNCIITPHIAWATKEARTRLVKTAADNIRAFLDGSPQNRIV